MTPTTDQAPRTSDIDGHALVVCERNAKFGVAAAQHHLAGTLDEGLRGVTDLTAQL